MKIISGDEFGLIKLISTQKKSVIDQYGSIDSSKSIINIFSKNDTKDSDSDANSEKENNENINLFISSLHENYTLNFNEKRIISMYKNEDSEINFISSTIKFEANPNNNTILINGTSDNKLNIVSFDEDYEFVNSSVYMPMENSNIALKRVSNSFFNKESVYSLYKNSPLVLYNIQNQKIEFKGKNLPNDELNLRIPMYDTDVVEVKNNPRLNYVSTAYGEIRLYDKKASTRPSLNKKVTNSKINKIDITDDGNYLFIGDNLGYCAMLDIRKNFSPSKVFKGNSGSIRTLVNIGQNNNLIVAGFDRYIRWYDYNNGDDEKVFVKNKINSAILVGLEKNKNEEFEDEEEGEIDDSESLEEKENEEIEDDENNEEESEGQNNSNNNNNNKSKSQSDDIYEEEENDNKNVKNQSNLEEENSEENEDDEEDNNINEDNEEDDEEEYSDKSGKENEEIEDEINNVDKNEEKEENEDEDVENSDDINEQSEENEDEEGNNEENEDEEEEEENERINKKRKRAKEDDEDEEIFNKYNNKKRKLN